MLVKRLGQPFDPAKKLHEAKSKASFRINGRLLQPGFKRFLPAGQITFHQKAGDERLLLRSLRKSSLGNADRTAQEQQRNGLTHGVIHASTFNERQNVKRGEMVAARDVPRARTRRTALAR